MNQLYKEKQINNINLPDIKKFSPSKTSEYYGAGFIAKTYCNLKHIRKDQYGYWQHGWHSQQFLIHPDMVMSLNVSSKKDNYYFVARLDEEIYLRNHDYKYVKAIGLPIIYLPYREIKRSSESLLVMPAHSLDYNTHSWNIEEYADEISGIRDRFSEVLICIHPSCWQKQYWVEAFQKRGFDVIKGAAVNDYNGLKRIYYLLSRFEYMTTNSIGSHVVYAAYLGAKVSIYGSYVEYKVEDYSNDPFYLQCPHILDSTIRIISKKNVYKNYPQLFCHPREAETRVQWGQFEVGHKNKLTLSEMKNLFHWRVQDRAAYKIRLIGHRIRKYSRKIRKYVRKISAFFP